MSAIEAGISETLNVQLTGARVQAGIVTLRHADATTQRPMQSDL